MILVDLQSEKLGAPQVGVGAVERGQVSQEVGVIPISGY
jgi:hypothetical protein